MEPLDALLAALHENPGDELAWGALADRLEEQGELERAELTRLTRNALSQRRVWELLRAGVKPCVPEVVNSIGMRFALIPAGHFWMGSAPDEPGHDTDEEPRHRVEITRPFYLGVFPVTQAQYQVVLGDNPSCFTPSDPQVNHVGITDTADFPVENVSWEMAVRFCHLLRALEPGHEYRLPTEAEWEYACRTVTSQPTYLGAALHASEANYDGNFPMWEHEVPKGPNLRRTTRVGSYPPNAFGLYDMLGNVYEWCSDWYHASWYRESPTKDPEVSQETGFRVMRGGSWRSPGSTCRSAYRDQRPQWLRFPEVGFRVVLGWQPQAPR